MVRDVLVYPHPALKQVAQPVHDADEIARVAADLVDTMDSFGHCVGLAATQLGEMVRMVVVDVTGHKKATTSERAARAREPADRARGGRARSAARAA